MISDDSTFSSNSDSEYCSLNSKELKVSNTTPVNASTNSEPLIFGDTELINSIYGEPKPFLSRNVLHILYKRYKQRVNNAYRSRHIFTIYGRGNIIRQALRRRGWIEKLAPDRYAKYKKLTRKELLMRAEKGNIYEDVIISKIINQYPAFFIWRRIGRIDKRLGIIPYRNRVRRGPRLNFTTKIGLIGCSEQEKWYRKDGVSCMSYPRFYRLGGIYAEHVSFIEDYQRTQCRSLMRYLWNNLMSSEVIINERDGTVPASVVYFALSNIRKQLSGFENNVIEDQNVKNFEKVHLDWQFFILSSNDIIFKKAKLKITYQELSVYANEAKRCLQKLESIHPDFKWDGCRNLWILKPGYRCRGNGVVVKKSLEEILQFASKNDNRRYIAQKYIERPHLIYKTKFDIRIYMLLFIGIEKVTIWLYKDCYLRFSSQVFSMNNLKRSIHLTNNSVQKKFKNEKERDDRLPKNNMWSLDQFKMYLRTQLVNDDVWENKIYRGFRENLTAIVMASLEETVLTENCFEIYGCDFMLDDTFSPILLEINANPDLSPSTNVTASLCPKVLRDVIKVVIDWSADPLADTGEYEKIFETKYKCNSQEQSTNTLVVEGKSMPLCKPLPVSCVQKIVIKPSEKKAKKKKLPDTSKILVKDSTSQLKFDKENMYITRNFVGDTPISPNVFITLNTN